MSAQHGLADRVVAQIHRVLSQFPEVEKGVLYESRAKGNFKRGSDIDLTLHGRLLDSRILGRIDDELDDLLLPYRFHLSIFSKITHPDVIDHIRRVGVIFTTRKSWRRSCGIDAANEAETRAEQIAAELENCPFLTATT